MSFQNPPRMRTTARPAVKNNRHLRLAYIVTVPTAGLQFDRLGFNQTRKYVVNCIAVKLGTEYKPVNWRRAVQ